MPTLRKRPLASKIKVVVPLHKLTKSGGQSH